MANENNFPTVRTGSLWLLFFCGSIVARGCIFGFHTRDVDALTAILGALTATHGVLVFGGGFIKSKWSADTAFTTEETTKKTIIPNTPSQQAGSMTVNADEVNVNTKEKEDGNQSGN